MVVFPCAKINIGLHIINKRQDGYHNIESIFYPIGLCDILEIIPASAFSYRQTGLDIPGEPDNNLVIKAWQLLHKTHQVGPVAIHLHKVIPMGAGLGGGSSDGAFALNLLNELFSLNLDDSELRKLALELGSDCPFFIRVSPTLVTGRGENLEELDFNLTKYWIKLIHPGIHIQTKEAFSNMIIRNETTNLKSTNYLDFKMYLERFKNDFEIILFPVHPRLAEIKQQLLKEGAFYASMSGSGSAIYGIFDREPAKTETVNFEYIGQLTY